MLGTPLPGAVKRTLAAPLDFKCLPSASLSLKTPVLSTIKASLIP